MDDSQKSVFQITFNWRSIMIGVLGVIVTIFTFLMLTIISLRWINPPFTSFTLQQNWEELEQERYSLRDWWIPSNEIPEHFKWAVIASEDQLFWSHFGFDIESIQEAWQQRQTGERNRGASTISQQVAKNLFLTPDQSFLRKGIEAGLTLLIELFWPKERIIEVYLNIAEFGPGIFGIGKASDTFFGNSAVEIDPEMASRMAAVLPNPKRMRVEPPSPFTQERSIWILKQMTHLSGIAYLPEIEESDTLSMDNIDPLLLEAEFFLDSEFYPDRTANSDSTDSLAKPDSIVLPDSLILDTLEIIHDSLE